MDRQCARIEKFVHRLLRRYGVEGKRALEIAVAVRALFGARRRALAAALVTGALVVAFLLWRRMLRSLPKVIAIGIALAVLGWQLLVVLPHILDGGSQSPAPEGRRIGEVPMPRASGEPIVENGVAAIVACGKKRGIEAVRAAPEPRTSSWSSERRGDCTIWYHHAPGAEQRVNRHQRAEPSPSRFQGWGQNRCKPLVETYLSTCRRLAGG